MTAVNKSACVTFGMWLKLITDCFLKGLPLGKKKRILFVYKALGKIPITSQKKYRYISSIASQLKNMEI